MPNPSQKPPASSTALNTDLQDMDALCKPMNQILAFYLGFEDAKNIHVLEVLIWGFGGGLRLLTQDWDLDIDSDMITGL